MHSRNDHLDAILQLAEGLQYDGLPHGETGDPSSALRYAVAKRLEDDLDLPVVVKYGDADAVKETYGVEGSSVWGVDHPPGWSLFRVGVPGQMHAEQDELMHKQFLAIGAWYVGMAEDQLQETHYHYLWPEDHPVVGSLPPEGEPEPED